MYIHKEGYTISIISTLLAILVILGIVYFAESWNFFLTIVVVAIMTLLFFIVRFFRMPNRELVKGEDLIVCPADGQIVVIEKTYESEILQAECWQISVFMSPNNVHVNRYPISGKITFSKYHEGKYLLAKHPKSSVLNERTTICLETKKKQKIVIRQIAGMLARRIVCYAKADMEVKQGEEIGFIKFGSRVDLFLPLSASISVTLGQKVKGGISILAELSGE